MLPHSRRARSGFSALEIVVAVGIVAIFVGVVGFRSESAVRRDRSAALVQLIKSTELASIEYFTDTGKYAEEFEDSQAESRRHLSTRQSSAGWAGPYIQRPFSDGVTSEFGRVRLYDSLQAGNWIEGFDTDGDGRVDLAGSGNLLVLWNLPADVATSLDRAIDTGVRGPWSETGRVVHQPAYDRVLVALFQ